MFLPNLQRLAAALQEGHDEEMGGIECRASAIKALAAVAVELYGDGRRCMPGFDAMVLLQPILLGLHDYSIDTRSARIFPATFSFNFMVDCVVSAFGYASLVSLSIRFCVFLPLAFRGDVGSWIREAAMQSLLQIVVRIRHDSSVESSFQSELVVDSMAQACLQQIMERISHMREVWIRFFCVVIISLRTRQDLYVLCLCRLRGTFCEKLLLCFNMRRLSHVCVTSCLK
jgi:hypothetical protein